MSAAAPGRVASRRLGDSHGGHRPRLRPMIVDGLAKAVLGLTTLDEVMRAAA